jgi:hypothetical protein
VDLVCIYRDNTLKIYVLRTPVDVRILENIWVVTRLARENMEKYRKYFLQGKIIGSEY